MKEGKFEFEIPNPEPKFFGLGESFYSTKQKDK